MIAEKHFAGRQCLGKRSVQEDAYAFSEVALDSPGEKGLLVVVADGMGGHAAGEQASELAVKTFVAAFHRDGATLADRFGAALEVANGAIAQAIAADPVRREGMGTTLLAAVLTPAGLEWISVGDSPLYLWRDGALSRLNADHSFRPLLHEMIERGEMTPEQAGASPMRNRLRAALIGAEVALIDISSGPLPLREGDVVLAASDGMLTLDDAALTDALAATADTDAEEIATSLLRAVLAADNSKQDNATVTVLKAGATSEDDPTGDEVPTRRRSGGAPTVFISPPSRTP